MQGIEAKVTEQFKVYNVTNRDILLALSGGVDSVVLLSLLSKLTRPLGLKLRAMHVNHGLIKEAKAWSDFCKRLCDEEKIPIDILNVSVPTESSLGLEGAARQVRYAALFKHSVKTVITAHHGDDQLETFFLQMLRGSGVDGLSAMVPYRRDTSSQSWLFRPFLAVSRDEIVKYAVAHKLRWIEDPSNNDHSLSRSYLRGSVLPKLRAKFPGFNASVMNVIKNLGETRDLTKEIATYDLQDLMQDDGGLDLGKFARLSELRKSNVIRHRFREGGLDTPTRSQLREAIRQCIEAQPDSSVCVNTNAASIRRFRGRIYIVPLRPSDNSDWSCQWSGQEIVELPGGYGRIEFYQCTGDGIARKFVNSEKLNICFAAPSKLFSLGRNRPRRQLRKVWQTLGILPWERTSSPIIYLRRDALFVGGLGVSARFLARPGEDAVGVKWVRP